MGQRPNRRSAPVALVLDSFRLAGVDRHAATLDEAACFQFGLGQTEGEQSVDQAIGSGMKSARRRSLCCKREWGISPRSSAWAAKKGGVKAVGRRGKKKKKKKKKPRGESFSQNQQETQKKNRSILPVDQQIKKKNRKPK
eukprot:TRINITY_DN5331_c0_g1_i1.p4 TRINITY_DN5331_c0_g1~~TRINITY_DN5331_c0_g1_i1.p4  ORF type:complete len:140 (-),score=13.09 TRINITY_DN5331_c0_g1_i1:81-500(-)